MAVRQGKYPSTKVSTKISTKVTTIVSPQQKYPRTKMRWLQPPLYFSACLSLLLVFAVVLSVDDISSDGSIVGYCERCPKRYAVKITPTITMTKIAPIIIPNTNWFIECSPLTWFLGGPFLSFRIPRSYKAMVGKNGNFYIICGFNSRGYNLPITSQSGGRFW